MKITKTIATGFLIFENVCSRARTQKKTARRAGPRGCWVGCLLLKGFEAGYGVFYKLRRVFVGVHLSAFNEVFQGFAERFDKGAVFKLGEKAPEHIKILLVFIKGAKYSLICAFFYHYSAGQAQLAFIQQVKFTALCRIGDPLKDFNAVLYIRAGDIFAGDLQKIAG